MADTKYDQLAKEFPVLAQAYMNHTRHEITFDLSKLVHLRKEYAQKNDSSLEAEISSVLGSFKNEARVLEEDLAEAEGKPWKEIGELGLKSLQKIVPLYRARRGNSDLTLVRTEDFPTKKDAALYVYNELCCFLESKKVVYVEDNESMSHKFRYIVKLDDAHPVNPRAKEVYKADPNARAGPILETDDVLKALKEIDKQDLVRFQRIYIAWELAPGIANQMNFHPLAGGGIMFLSNGDSFPQHETVGMGFEQCLEIMNHFKAKGHAPEWHTQDTRYGKAIFR